MDRALALHDLSLRFVLARVGPRAAPSEIAALLRLLRREVTARARVRAWVRAWFAVDLGAEPRRFEAALARLLRDGRISLGSQRVVAEAGGGGGGAEDPAEDVPSKPRVPLEEQAWVEIVLLDERGRPQAGERYRVTAADGQVWEGHLDGDGFARVQGVDPGDCTVVFPRRDRDDFFPEEEEDPEWIEIQLLRDDGVPQAGARFVAAFDNGVTREGRLDARGRVRIQGELGAHCDVRFPDFDGEDLSAATGSF